MRNVSFLFILLHFQHFSRYSVGIRNTGHACFFCLQYTHAFIPNIHEFKEKIDDFNMVLNYKIIFGGLVFALITLVQYGYGIKCWDCRSDADPKCSDPFENKTFAIADCRQQQLEFLPDARATMCRKIRQKVHGVWRYIRGCAYLGEPGIQGDERFCLMRTGTYNIFMEYCTCNTKDGCNSGVSNLVSKGVLGVCLVIAWKSMR